MVSEGCFIMLAKVGDTKVLGEPMLGGHEVFDACPHRRHLDPAGDIGGERIRHQVTRLRQAQATAEAMVGWQPRIVPHDESRERPAGQPAR